MGVAARVTFLDAVQPSDGMILEKVAPISLRGSRPPGLSRFSLAPGAESPLDQHEDEEVWFIASGRGTIVRGGIDTVPVAAGDVVEFPSEVSHTLKNTGDQPLVVFAVWWV
jgi:mannose-6-phosphate isomerase-like protein (cupin superfamily)